MDNDDSSPASPPDRTERRNLGERPFVSLAEALTWLAFRDALTGEELRAQVEGVTSVITDSPEERLRRFFTGHDEPEAEVPGTGYFVDRERGLERLSEAWQRLRDEADCGRIKLRGRYTSTYPLANENPPELAELTGSVLAIFSQFDVSTGGIRRQPEATPEVIWRDHPVAIDREWEAASSDREGARDGYLMVEVEALGLAGLPLTPIELPRLPHEQVVDWCRNWIKNGRGNGMDKAWLAFKVDPAHHGLSRDDAFRPAWRQAKTR